MPNAPVSQWILRLESTDEEERNQAAHELFRIGCAVAEPVLKQWFADPEFRALIRGGPELLTVGIAVEPQRFEKIRTRFGQPHLAAAPSDQDVAEFELKFPHGVRLDILTTRAPQGDGAVARCLARLGEGIQQVECDVRDVARATEILRKNFALEPVYPEPRAGTDETRVNFFLAPAGEGRKVLIELVESSARKRKR